MAIVRPPFTGDGALDSWTNQITQSINMGLSIGQSTGGSSAGPTGNTAIYLYQRTSVNTAPNRPTSVEYDYTDIENVTITANNGWLGEVPTTSGKYLWITFRYISNLQDTITNVNTWNTVVLLSVDGDDGADGTPGATGSPAPRFISRRVYISSASGVPSSPSATLTWSTLALSSLTSGWSETAPTAIATSTTLVYFSDFLFSDDTGAATTSAATGGTPKEGISFSGLVTFNNGDFALDGSTITTIDGGNVAAGTVTANKLSASSISGLGLTIGTLSDSATGERIVISDSKILVYDSSNVIRVKIGDLS